MISDDNIGSIDVTMSVEDCFFHALERITVRDILTELIQKVVIYLYKILISEVIF